MHEQNGKFNREIETIKRKQTETLELKYTMPEENRTEKLNGELQKKTSLYRRKNLWPRRQDVLIYPVRGLKEKKKNEKWWRNPMRYENSRGKRKRERDKKYI